MIDNIRHLFDKRNSNSAYKILFFSENFYKTNIFSMLKTSYRCGVKFCWLIFLCNVRYHLNVKKSSNSSYNNFYSDTFSNPENFSLLETSTN